MDSSGKVVHEFPALSAIFGSGIPDSGILVSTVKFIMLLHWQCVAESIHVSV